MAYLDDDSVIEPVSNEDDAMEMNADDREALLLKEDAAATREESTSEPEHLAGPQDDSGTFDENNWEEAELRRGIGDTIDEEDLGQLGFHEERFTEAIDDGSGDEDKKV